MSRPRRIAYVNHTAVLGGAEVALENLVNQLDRERWEPHALIGARGPLVERLKSSGVPVDVFDLPPSLARIRQGDLGLRAILNLLRGGSGLAYGARLSRRFRQLGVEVVHANSLRACVLGGLAGRLAGIPTIWQMHCVLGSGLMSPSGLRLLQTLARFLPSHIICNSRWTAADFTVPDERLTVVPCGVDASRFVPNGVALHDRPRIGMVARFAPLKGQHLLVEAARQIAEKHPRAEFLIAGTPLFGEEAYAQEVQENAQRVLPRRVRFLGFVDDVPALLRDVDILVNPSTVAEGFGQAIVEAMMAGKPVVASALGGPIDVIDNGVTGRLVPAGDSAALAGAIDDLLSNPEAAAEMGRRGRERAVQRYDIRQTTRAIEQVYEKLLTAR
jgi:glycosyltransferase involved in cell wall biosynthesis